MVAASAVRGALSPAVAWAVMAGVIVCCVILFSLANRGKVTSHVPLPKEPEVDKNLLEKHAAGVVIPVKPMPADEA